MACLVTGNDNTRSIGKVADAGVLQGIELVTIAPAKRSSHLLPAFVELVGSHFLSVGQETCAEEVMGVGPFEDAKVEHELDDGLVQAHFRIAVVLAELLGNKDRLVLERDVANLQVAQFTWAYQGVILHHAGQKKRLVVLLKIGLHAFQHFWSQVFAELLMFRHHLDAFNRIGTDVLSCHHELG